MDVWMTSEIRWRGFRATVYPDIGVFPPGFEPRRSSIRCDIRVEIRAAGKASSSYRYSFEACSPLAISLPEGRVL